MSPLPWASLSPVRAGGEGGLHSSGLGIGELGKVGEMALKLVSGQTQQQVEHEGWSGACAGCPGC